MEELSEETSGVDYDPKAVYCSVVLVGGGLTVVTSRAEFHAQKIPSYLALARVGYSQDGCVHFVASVFPSPDCVSGRLC